MKLAAIALGLSLVAPFSWSGSSRSRTNPYERDPEAVRAGAKLYRRHCADCHGESGEGIGRKPPLKSPAVRYAPPAALFGILTNGVMRRGMPSWSRLPEQQRWQIITYLKHLSGTP